MWPQSGTIGVTARFPQAPNQEQLIQPQGLNSPCVPGPTLGVHLISSGSSQPPLEAGDIKPLTEEEPKAP